MKRIALFTIICLMASACQQTQYESEIARIDSLLLELDTAMQVHANIDTSGYATYSSTFSSNLGFVQNAFKNAGDTMSRDLAMLLSDYRDLRKPYGQFKSKYEANGKELEFSQAQLESLHHDLEHNLLEPQIVSKMMATEAEAVEKVTTETMQLKSSKVLTKQKNDILQPKIDSLIAAIKTKN